MSKKKMGDCICAFLQHKIQHAEKIGFAGTMRSNTQLSTVKMSFKVVTSDLVGKTAVTERGHMAG